MKHNRLKKENMRNDQNVVSTVLKIFGVVLWAAVILFCFLHRDDLTVEELLRYTPRNLWAAAAVMLALFALKSLTVVLYSGILYIIDGILFPLPVAILLNLYGTIIMLSLPYFIGKKTGAATVEFVRAKYPKAESIHRLRTKNDLFFTFSARIIRLPSDIVSLYMGAVGVDYLKYLLGSLLGMLPHMITYPIMGMSITEIHSPQFRISFCVELAYILITAAGYALYRRRQKPNRNQA